jgi:hypothetical protein
MSLLIEKANCLNDGSPSSHRNVEDGGGLGDTDRILWDRHSGLEHMRSNGFLRSRFGVGSIAIAAHHDLKNR